MKTIGKTKRNILKYLSQCDADNFAPTLREIASHVGIAFPTVREHLQDLETGGYLVRSRTARGIRLTQRTSSIPIIGTIAAGDPIMTIEEAIGVVDWSPDIFGGHAANPYDPSAEHALVALHVKGNSMINAAIHDGDTAIIRRQASVNNGEIAAVLIDDACTLKRVIFNPQGLTLLPENEDFEPINPRQEEDVRIYGKLVGILRTFH